MERTSTPVRLATTYTVGSAGRISSHNIRDCARKESRGCIFGDIPEFLDTFFPVDQLSKGKQTGERRILFIMAELQKKGLFKDSKWTKVPETGLEKTLYQPLLQIAKTINEICVPKNRKVEWRDIHSTAPTSVHGQKDRPDMAAISKFPGMVVRGRRATHWHNILLPAEVKGKWQNDDLEQLLGYVRVMLREQWNRRFTFGLLFTRREFQVWLFDRSGAIGSTRINFHNHPRKLVRVIAGLTVMTLAQLGYDTTMKLMSQSCTDEADAQWKITSPSGENFIIFERTSLSRSQVIVGRATRVWKAWRVVDMKRAAADRPVYVLKDTWRDDRRCLEGDLYEKAGEGDGLAQLYCHGAVNIDGSADTTADTIRRGVRPPENSIPQLVKEKTQRPSTDWTTDTMAIPTPPSRDQNPHLPQNKLHGRTHSRTIMSTYGWPIHRFASFQEVIKAIEFALKGHRHLCQHGVLHRDISPGNILITPDNRGALIDLDYAIDKANYKTLASDERTGTLPYMSSEIILGETLMDQTERVQHGPQHDLESFFWVLCWLATHFDMPGHMKEDLSSAVSDLFSENCTPREMALRKKLFFVQSSPFKLMVKEITPYFRPLEGTLKSWMGTLKDLYLEDDTVVGELLHEKFLKALHLVDEVIVKDDMEDQYKRATEKELERRRLDLLPPSARTVEREHTQPSMEVD